jgi:hypothetical protein
MIQLFASATTVEDRGLFRAALAVGVVTSTAVPTPFDTKRAAGAVFLHRENRAKIVG